MAGNTQMNENERGVFALHGLTGFFIAVALLLSILAFLTIANLGATQANATKYYQVNQDLNALKSGSVFSSGDQSNGTKNHTMRTYAE